MFSSVVIGSTGAIGRQVIRNLAANPECSTVYAVTRRTVDFLAERPGNPSPRDNLSEQTKIKQVLVPELADLSLSHFADVAPPVDVGFVCLGSTIKSAGSKEEFRKVDFDLVKSSSELLVNQLRVRALCLISAVGASRSSMFFYSQVKGEAEDAVTDIVKKSEQKTSLTIIRPPLILTPEGRDPAALGGKNSRTSEWISQSITMALRLPYSVGIPSDLIARVAIKQNQDALSKGPGAEATIEILDPSRLAAIATTLTSS